MSSTKQKTEQSTEQPIAQPSTLLPQYRNQIADEGFLQHLYELIGRAEQVIKTPTGDMELTVGDVEFLLVDFINQQQQQITQENQTASKLALVRRGISLELQAIPSVNAKLQAKLLWQDKV